MEYIHAQFALDPTGVTIERVLDKFGSYLAFLNTKGGKQIARNTVMSYYRHVKLWLIELYQLRAAVSAKLLKMGSTLDGYCMKRNSGGFIKKAPACTKDHLRTLMVYQYSTEKNATDYQDAALLCLLWYLFGRASDLSSLQKANLTVSAAGVLIVRLMRMKTSVEQGLSLYYDEKFLGCPLTAMAAAVVMQSTPHAALLGNLPSVVAPVQAEAMSSIPLIDLLNQPLGAVVWVQPMDAAATMKVSVAALPGVHSQSS